MTEKPKPALSAEEWAKLQTRGDGRDDGMTGSVLLRDGVAYVFHEGCERAYWIEDRHAAAALCLHGLPEGFTREHLEVLKEIVRIADPHMPTDMTMIGHEIEDRIESLLSPEDG